MYILRKYLNLNKIVLVFFLLFSPTGSLFHRQSLRVLHLHSHDPRHSTWSRQVDVSIKRLQWLPADRHIHVCRFTTVPFFSPDKLPNHAFASAALWYRSWNEPPIGAARFRCVVFPCQRLSCTGDIHCYATALYCFSALQRRVGQCLI